MDEQAVNAARERVALADRRLVALQEAGVDTAALVSHLHFARAAIDAGRLDEAVAVVEEVLASASRLADGGTPAASLRRSSARLHAVRTPGLAPEMVAKAITVHELDKRIEETCAKAVDGRMLQFGERLEAVVAAVGTLTGDIGRLRSGLEEGLGRMVAEQGEELRRQTVEAATAAATAALAGMPTRADLDKLGESLRKDLDWQVERAAAERGWCTMADVDAALERVQVQRGGDPALAPSARHARLETVLADFVHQLQRQQERMLDLVQLRADAPAAAAAPASEPAAEPELDVLSHSSQFRVLREAGYTPEAPAAGGGDEPADDRATRLIASRTPPPAGSVQPEPDEHPATDAHAEAEPVPVLEAQAGPAPTAAPEADRDDHESSSDLRPATMRIGNHTVLEPDADRIVAAVAAEMAAQGGSSKLVRSGENSGPLSQLPDQAELDALLSQVTTSSMQAAVLAAAMPQAAADPAPPAPLPAAAIDEAALRERVLRLLPEVLADGGVRQRILALVATEALQPGALGELTGIRAFIRREIRQAAEQVAAELRRESAREQQPA